MIVASVGVSVRSRNCGEDARLARGSQWWSRLVCSSAHRRPRVRHVPQAGDGGQPRGSFALFTNRDRFTRYPHRSVAMPSGSPTRYSCSSRRSSR
jgi:hypothetical protein